MAKMIAIITCLVVLGGWFTGQCVSKQFDHKHKQLNKIELFMQ